jgi:hypothetical protein
MMMAASGSPAIAACPQALAIYDEAQSGAEIAFAGPLRDVDGMQHRFSLSFAESGVDDGWGGDDGRRAGPALGRDHA